MVSRGWRGSEWLGKIAQMISGPVTVEKFIKLVSLAWKQLWVYPEGHPARAGAVERAFNLLTVLVAPTGELSFGVDRDALVCAGDRLTDTNAQQLAGQLFRRNVAVVRFEEGVRAEDLERWLSLLHPDPIKKHKARLWDEAADAGVLRIVIEPVDFSGVEATDDLESEIPEVEGRAGTQTLWQRILDKVLTEGQQPVTGPRIQSGGGGGGGGGLGQVVQLLRGLITEGEDGNPAAEGDHVASTPGTPLAPDVVKQQRQVRMKHLSEHLAAAVTGHLDLAENAEEANESELRQVAELVKALPSAMRPRVVDAAARRLASADGNAEGLKMLAASSSAAAMVGSLRRLREEDFQFSEHALSIVDALAWQEMGALQAEEELSEEDRKREAHELREFFRVEDLDHFQGGGQDDRRLLLELPPVLEPFEDLPPAIEESRRSLSDQYQTKTLSLTLLELIARARDPEAADPLIHRLETVFATLVTGGQLTAACEIVNSLRGNAEDTNRGEGTRGAAQRALRTLAGPSGTAAVVDYISRASVEEYDRPKRLVDAFGNSMIRSLLSALSEEDDMVKRRRLLSFMTALGGEVANLAITALADSRWFVVRNMLGLLREVGDARAVPAVRQSTSHENAKVRVEAVKTLALLDKDPPKELIERLLADSDPLVAELATTSLAGHGGAGVESLIQLLLKKDPLARHRSQRLKAFKTLGTVGDPVALRKLSRYSNRFFVVDHIGERRAAFSALEGYAPEARAAWLKKGRKSKDPEIKRVSLRLWDLDQSKGQG